MNGIDVVNIDFIRRETEFGFDILSRFCGFVGVIV